MSFFSPDCTLEFIDILMDATSHIYILDTIFISFQWALSFSQKNTRSHITAQQSFSLLLLALLRYFIFTAQYKTSEEVLHMLWQNSVNVRDEKWLSNIDSKILNSVQVFLSWFFFYAKSHWQGITNGRTEWDKSHLHSYEIWNFVFLHFVIKCSV